MTGGSLCLVLQARIKKIMQTDEEIGKVAAAVPVIICILLARLGGGYYASMCHLSFLDCGLSSCSGAVPGVSPDQSV